MFKSKSANSATHGYPTAGSLVDVCKWIVVALDGLEHGVVQEIM